MDLQTSSWSGRPCNTFKPLRMAHCAFLCQFCAVSHDFGNVAARPRVYCARRAGCGPPGWKSRHLTGFGKGLAHR
eukprot:5717989-Amphidinium_carterae.1